MNMMVGDLEDSPNSFCRIKIFKLCSQDVCSFIAVVLAKFNMLPDDPTWHRHLGFGEALNLFNSVMTGEFEEASDNLKALVIRDLSFGESLTAFAAMAEQMFKEGADDGWRCSERYGACSIAHDVLCDRGACVCC